MRHVVDPNHQEVPLFVPIHRLPEACAPPRPKHRGGRKNLADILQFSLTWNWFRTEHCDESNPASFPRERLKRSQDALLFGREISLQQASAAHEGIEQLFSTKIAKLFQEKPTHDNTDRDTTHQSHMCSWKSDMTINTEADFESLHLVWCLMFDQQPPCGSASMRFSALAHEAALVVQFNPTVPGLMEVQKHHPRVPVLDPKIPQKKTALGHVSKFGRGKTWRNDGVG